MEKQELFDWLVSPEVLRPSIRKLRAWSAARSFGNGVVDLDVDLASYEPDWRRLILAGSLLAESTHIGQQEIALMIAQGAVVFGPSAMVRDAGAIILTQMSNARAVGLAENREHVRKGISQRLGFTETLLSTRRIVESSIVLNSGRSLSGNPFQKRLWVELHRARWTSATAPTAAGKTFLVLNWLLTQFENGTCKIAVFLAPTRALVSEIEQEILEFKDQFKVPGLRVASMPIAELGDGGAPTILVFTQERLHLFLNAFETPPSIDIAVIDEAQKLSDGMRGVILQDAIERIARIKESCRFVFLSPHAENPETLLEDAPEGAITATVPGGPPTVTQNLLVAAQVRGKPMLWQLSLPDTATASETPVGQFQLHDRPAGKSTSKRLSFIALALGRETTGTLIYANGAAEAEKIASQIHDGLADDSAEEVDEELRDLSDFCRTAIHPKFQLVHLLLRGVAFHYGNMPSILRAEIERLFTLGKIRFLVCTSTLVEGVNLACRTIIVRGPKKGKGVPMSPQDFWNLAGRAGRWGSDFHGNIICIDTHDAKQWPFGVPRKAAYPIYRETDQVLERTQIVLDYVESRSARGIGAVDEDFEPVAAYLMAWYARTGSVSNSPSAKRLDREVVHELDEALGKALSSVELPANLMTAHPGISALALQSLLSYFEGCEGELDWLLPPPPESDDAAELMKAVFDRIDQHLYPAFGKDVEAAQWAFAFTTINWMRGKRLGEMISGALDRERRRGTKSEDLPYAKIIRDTMRLVEEVARFKAPKYLSAYLDVLKHHYTRLGVEDQFPDDLPFELYLEFGVSTQTLLSLIGLGLSRTSAIEMNEFLGRSDLTEDTVFGLLSERNWEGLELPNVVKREIRTMLLRRQPNQISA